MNSRLLFVILFLPVLPLSSLAEETVQPDQIEFRRQAVQRLVFDEDQGIPLSSLRPTKILELDLMHPELLSEEEAGAKVDWQIIEGDLHGTASDARGKSLRWVGGFNPFATYSLKELSLAGKGRAGLVFRDSKTGDSLIASIQQLEGGVYSVGWEVRLGGETVLEESWKLELPDSARKEITLHVQMAAVGANLFYESHGKSHLVGFADFSEHLDLRERARFARYDFGVLADLPPGASVSFSGAHAALTPGTGQADIRAVTDEEGVPLLDEGRLWFTVTVRGRALPHPLQGVFSLNPSVFDLRFEGIIVFEMGDGLFRNELASHLFRDSETGEWRGWTTGFSALGTAGGKEEKTILAVWSKRDPRKGFSVMNAKPVGIQGAHEDPHGVYDRAAGKWRLLLCERHEKYQAGIWESKEWDRGYQRLAGPVEMDSTGTMIQAFGETRYALFGSADRTVYIRTYPELEPAGELKIELPPWNEENGTRIWPNVIPLPEGYPAPFIALMMDRVNFPGMPKPNWTYGALYLYYGYPEGE